MQFIHLLQTENVGSSIWNFQKKKNLGMPQSQYPTPIQPYVQYVVNAYYVPVQSHLDFVEDGGIITTDDFLYHDNLINQIYEWGHYCNMYMDKHHPQGIIKDVSSLNQDQQFM